MPNTKKIQVLIIVGFLFRCLWCFYFECDAISDAFRFRASAEVLLTTKVFTVDGKLSAFILPGYPIFLALLGNLKWLVVFIQMVLGSISIFLIYQLAKKYFDEKTAFIAALLFAVNINMIAYCGVFVSETLLLFLFLGYLVLPSGRWVKYLIASGIVLIKPVFILFFLYELLWQHSKAKPRIVMALMVVSLPLFWCGRNFIQLKHVAISSNSGVNLYIGNNAFATGGYITPIAIEAEDEFEKDNHYFHEAVQYTQTHLEQLPKLLFKKQIHTWLNDGEALKYWTAKGLNDELKKERLSYFVPLQLLIYFFIVGLSALYYLMNFRKINDYKLWAVVLFTILFTAVYFGNPRFHIQCIPVFCIFSAATISSFIRKIRKQKSL